MFCFGGLVSSLFLDHLSRKCNIRVDLSRCKKATMRLQAMRCNSWNIFSLFLSACLPWWESQAGLETFSWVPFVDCSPSCLSVLCSLLFLSWWLWLERSAIDYLNCLLDYKPSRSAALSFKMCMFFWNVFLMLNFVMLNTYMLLYIYRYAHLLTYCTSSSCFCQVVTLLKPVSLPSPKSRMTSCQPNPRVCSYGNLSAAFDPVSHSLLLPWFCSWLVVLSLRAHIQCLC